MRIPGQSAFTRSSSSSSLPSLHLTLTSVKRGAAMNRLDLLLLLCLLLPLTVYLEFYAQAHVQPIKLNDPALLKPFLPSLVSSRAVLFLSFVLPPIIHFIVLRRTIPLLSFVYGLTQTNFLTLFSTNVLKVIVGRPRPFFATLCKSYDPPQSNSCTGGTAHLIDDARRSFPSGHSSLAFSAAMFLCLCLAKMSLNTSVNGASKLVPVVITVSPLAVATLVAVSRLVDFHHHYSDVIAGTLLGSFWGALSFVVYFYPNILTNAQADEFSDGTSMQQDTSTDQIDQIPV